MALDGCHFTRFDGLGLTRLQERRVDQLEDLFQFSRGRNDLVQQKKLFRDYRDYEQYQEIVQATQDP